jgi:putative ABC transport system permease protein
MIGLILKLFRGHVRKHALEAVLCLVGIALGVAVVVGIDLAVAASVSSFAAGVETLADRATHSITSTRGGEGGVTDAEYVALARADLPTPLSPVIDRRVVAIAGNGQEQAIHFLGIDPFAERKLRTHTQLSGAGGLSGEASDRFMTEPYEVVLVKPLAQRLGVGVGGKVTVTINTHQAVVTVAGIAALAPPADAQLPDLMIADISTAQELFGAVGVMDRIDVLIPDARGEALLRKQLTAMGEGLVLTSTDDRSKSLADLTAAYRLNLYALSLMASFVAIFIVYNAMLVSVQQRSLSLAILRSLGSSRWQLGSIYLVEAVVFAAVGAALGIGGGYLIAKVLVGFIATTINDLYASVRPGAVTLDALTVGKGVAVALASGVLGAAVPLWKASRTDPVSLMRPSDAAASARRTTVATLIAGLVLLAGTGAIPWLPTRSPVVGFVMAIGAALGFALLCPFVTRVTCAVLDAWGRRRQSLPLRMATAGVSRSLGITGIAVAAMMLALAMSIGIQTMVANFRGALDTWMEQRFGYDLFLAPRLAVDYHMDAVLEPAVMAWARRQPEVAEVVTSRYHDAELRGQAVQILGTEVATLLRDKTLGLKAASEGAFDPKTEVLVSEPLAGKLKLGVGDAVDVDSLQGPLHMKVYAVYYDFRSERGQVMLDADLYAAAFQSTGVNTLHVKLRDSAQAEAVAARWARELAPQAVVVKSFVQLKGDILNVFDRTFKVTDVLAWLAGGIAFCGLAGALIALSLARAKEYAILTSLGLSQGQTAVWLLAEGLLIALTAAGVAIVAGSALAYILAHVIQYRSFGWSIPTMARPRFWVQTVVLAAAAALVASVYPLRMLRKMPPAQSLRQE